MPKARVLLVTKSEEGTERFVTSAQMQEEGGARAFAFEEGGAHYIMRTGAPARVTRKGDIAYELVLDPVREMPVIIHTSYGEIEAVVRVLRFREERSDGEINIEADYSLFFSGEEHKHKIKFSARFERDGGKGDIE